MIDGTSRSTPATGAPPRPQPSSGVNACTALPKPHPRPEGKDSYTISEVVAFTGLTAHTLRWYERIGLMPASTARTPASAASPTATWTGWSSSASCG
ncbi:hypothetical protein SCYAM73S_07590 [Streptomyces cyaneofuscatus]